MRLYLYGDAAENPMRYIVTIGPAGDADFVAGELPASLDARGRSTEAIRDRVCLWRGGSARRPWPIHG